MPNNRKSRSRRRAIKGEHAIVFPRSGRDRDIISWTVFFALFAILLFFMDYPWLSLPAAIASAFCLFLILKNPRGSLTLHDDRITWNYEAFHEGTGEVKVSDIVSIDIDDDARSRLKLAFDGDREDLDIPFHADGEDLFECLKEMYPKIEIAFETDDL